ncbi:MAG: alpha/beta hydrolase [Actinomycetota bacterium]|nr:alpha/beta hydrolase [Actinomycetota bacterium]
MTYGALGQRWESSGGTVRYDVFGDGPPVVLVHGTPSSTYLWRQIIPELANVRTVYAYDLLGYGLSEKRDGQDVSLGAQTRLLAQLLDHWELEEPAIVGHDFGGAITLRTHLLERRLFSAIALLDPVALGPWGTTFFQLVRDNVGVFQQIPATIHRAIVAAYLRGAFHRPMSDEALAPYVDPWLGTAGQNAFYRQIAQADQRFTDEVEELYGQIRAPVLILWGEEDGWIPVQTAHRLQALIPDSELQLVPAAGHFLQEDAPEVVAGHLVRFLS